MDDLDKFIEKQKRLDPEFEKGFEEGYRNFKIGILLRQARQEAGLTQDEIAKNLKLKNLLFQGLKIMRKTFDCRPCIDTQVHWESPYMSLFGNFV